VAFTNRMAYVIFYQGNKVLKKLETLPVDVSYVSKKMSYAIIYSDVEAERQIKKELRFVKGFKHMSPSKTFDETLNF
jgi:uncharacterized protein YlbG (UPF0298 family)